MAERATASWFVRVEGCGMPQLLPVIRTVHVLNTREGGELTVLANTLFLSISGLVPADQLPFEPAFELCIF